MTSTTTSKKDQPSDAQSPLRALSAKLDTLSPYAFPVARAAAGFLVFAHGVDHVAGGMDHFAASLAGMGFPSPELFAYLGVFGELVCGLLLGIGLFTRFAGVVVFVSMMIAAFTGHSGGFWDIGTGEGVKLEFPILIGFVALASVFTGSGGAGLDVVLASGDPEQDTPAPQASAEKKP